MGQPVLDELTLPAWVPHGALHYLAHTESGLSIRALARAADCHPSTILRQVRRIESRRDDPLIDYALRMLSTRYAKRGQRGQKGKETMIHDGTLKSAARMEGDDMLTRATIDREARRVLQRMSETRAVLAVARDMDTAVVVRETSDGNSLRTAVVGRDIAQAMALKEWISSPEPNARIARYFITNVGRAALRQLTAADDNRAHGFAERPHGRLDETMGWAVPELDENGRNLARYYATESPLVGLARRRNKDGQPFLDKDLVAAGERLREDYELAITGPRVSMSLEVFLSSKRLDVPKTDPTKGSAKAAERLRLALTELGPGLGDVVLRCCCYLEGLEQTEKKLGWSARSGKIVLRIALQQLRRHYRETEGKFAPKIG